MKKVVKLKESDLTRIVKRVINESNQEVSGNQISINIPEGIISYMDELGIPKNNQSKLFEEYIDFLLGVNYRMEVDSFMTWAEEEDNITDFKDYD